MKRTELTIIVPVYNRERYIKDCVKSILNQTYSDFRLLIVNDGSTDSSMDIVNSFTDSRINIVDLPHRGCWPTKNAAVKHVETEYLMFVDSDDVITPDYICKMMDSVEKNPDYNYYYPIRLMIADSALKDSGRVWRYLDNADAVSIVRLFLEKAIAGVPHPGSVICSDLFLKTGLFKDDLKNFADAVFVVQNCNLIRFKSLDIAGYINRQHDNQTNKDKSHAAKATAFLLSWVFRSELVEKLFADFSNMKDMDKNRFILQTFHRIMKGFPGYESEFSAYAEYWVNLTRM